MTWRSRGVSDLSLQAATMREMQTIRMKLMPKIQEKTAAAIERTKNKKANN